MKTCQVCYIHWKNDEKIHADASVVVKKLTSETIEELRAKLIERHGAATLIFTSFTRLDDPE